MLGEFHRMQPLRRGMPAEELRSRLKLGHPPRLFEEVIATAEHDGIISGDGTTIRLAEFSIALDSSRRAAADRYLAALKQFPYSPPSPSDFAVDPDTLGALVDLGELVKIADDIVYTPMTYAKIERDVLAIIDRDGSITLAQFRDHFATSRKYAQATLEYLDQRRVTRRVGDSRVRFVGNNAQRGG
jgi:selenocysteine-specific elongation factor